MELLTPLFKCMTAGVTRLEDQEAQEQAKADSARLAVALETGEEPPAKQPKTKDDILARARRLTIRLASMANRCFWVSAAELTVHILTDGDCLQTHNHCAIFTKQIQWALQECKKQLNKEPSEKEPELTHLKLQTVAIHVKDEVAHNDEDEDAEESDNDEKVDDDFISKVEVCTHSTNATDDYTHRGTQLWNMSLYVYRMYVRRIPRPKERRPGVFFFEEH